MIIEKKISKFRSAYYIDILSYQKYPNIFSNLIFIKKIIIACTYLVMSIINLRLNEISSIALYH